MAAKTFYASDINCQSEQIRPQGSCEEAPDTERAFISLSSQSPRRSRDFFSDQSQYIEMDLAMSIQWEKVARA
eukprot:c7313_g2_i1 orf=2-217(-)